MLYVILLLILAVLLFGASAVIGVFGWIAGFIAFSAALTLAALTFEIEPQKLMAVLVLVVCGVLAVAKLSGFIDKK